MLPTAERFSAISFLRNEKRVLSMPRRVHHMLTPQKLLEDANHLLRQLPEATQDTVARAVIHQLEEEPESGDREAIAASRYDYRCGDFVMLDQLRHEIELGDR